jgi:hypothetical protein
MTPMPIEPTLQPIHDRTYDIRVYRRGTSALMARGEVRDVKPPGVFVEGDPDPLEMHDMVVDLDVSFPELVITDVRVGFSTFPQPGCPGIAEHYRSLIGLSIARGFTHEVRRLFGGPRGCTHVTALLQAMAPAVVQSMWSMDLIARRQNPVGLTEAERAAAIQETRLRNVDTCHVWAGDGELVAKIEAGERVAPAIPMGERLVALGRNPDNWWIEKFDPAPE